MVGIPPRRLFLTVKWSSLPSASCPPLSNCAWAPPPIVPAKLQHCTQLLLLLEEDGLSAAYGFSRPRAAPRAPTHH